MLLKRHYDIPPGWEPHRNIRQPDGTLPEPTVAADALLHPLPAAGISVIHTGIHPEQNFSRRLIEAGVSEGWLSLQRGKLLLHTRQGDFVYTIVAMPGRTCLHCGEHWATDPQGQLARAHLATLHAGVPSPDPHWPLGYSASETYACILNAEQHAQWQCPPYATVSHQRWKDEER